MLIVHNAQDKPEDDVEQRPRKCGRDAFPGLRVG